MKLSEAKAAELEETDQGSHDDEIYQGGRHTENSNINFDKVKRQSCVKAAIQRNFANFRMLLSVEK